MPKAGKVLIKIHRRKVKQVTLRREGRKDAILCRNT